MSAVNEIQDRVQAIDPTSRNRTRDIFLNVINNEFIVLDGKITIPRIPVKELDYELSVKIVDDLISYIPEFFLQHKLLKKRKPASEQHSLHFVQIIRGRFIYFVHIYKIDFKFGGDTANIVEQGNSDFYPSYNTDRVYYKSRIIPENSVLHHEGDVIDFSPIRIFDSKRVESDQHFNTFAIFDEVNTKEITLEIASLLGPDMTAISPKLYPFIAFDYFTATFNTILPTQENIMKGVEIFEPLFLFIFSRYGNYTDIISPDGVENTSAMSLRLPVKTSYFASSTGKN